MKCSRFISALLALVMILALLPTAALARCAFTTPASSMAPTNTARSLETDP